MRIPNSVTDRSIVRIGIQVDGSFNETLEITGAQLKKLAGLLGGEAKTGDVVPKLVAGDASAEKRENTPLVKVETRNPETVTKVPESGTGEAPKTGTPEVTSEAPSAENPNPGLPTETPDLGE